MSGYGSPAGTAEHNPTENPVCAAGRAFCGHVSEPSDTELVEAFAPTVIQSAHGHRLIGTDHNEPTESHESCMTCGGMWALRDRGDGTGVLESADGSPADDCTHDTGQVHGYSGERHCHEHDTTDRDGETCEHMRSCNCLFCN